MTRLAGFAITYLIATTSFALAQNAADSKLCGAKSLYVALRTLGKAPDRFEKLLSTLGTVPVAGFSLLELQVAATKFQCDAVALNLDAVSLEKISKRYEVILHLEPGHFLLLGKFHPGGVLLFDPDRRTINLNEKDFLKRWKGNCLVIGNEPIQIPTDGFRWWKYLLVIFLLFGGFWTIKLLTFRFWKSRFFLNASRSFFLTFLFLSFTGCEVEKVHNIERTALPKLELGGDDFIDLGSVEPSDKPIELEFIILNGGSAPLVISSVQPSCQCSKVSAVPEILNAGERGSIRMVLDRKKLGPHDATAIVHCNCIVNPIFKVKANWDVQGTISASPSEISTDLHPGTSKSIFVRLNLNENVELKNVLIKSILDREGNDIEHVAVLQNGICKLTLSASAHAVSQITTGVIEIKSGTGADPLHVHWTVSVQNRLSLTPKTVWFRTNSETGTDVHTQILVRAIDSADLENIQISGVGDVEMALPYRETKLPSDEKLRIFDLSISKEFASKLNAIVIRTGDNEFEVEVPIGK